MVSNEKRLVNFFEGPLYLMSCFSPAALKGLCLCLQQCEYDVRWCGSLWVYPAWNLFSFLYTEINIFTYFEKFVTIISSNILPSSPSSPSGTSRVCMLVYLTVSYKPFRFCSVFFILYQAVESTIGRAYNIHLGQFLDSFSYFLMSPRQIILFDNNNCLQRQ